MRRALFSICLVSMLLSGVLGAACGATAGTSSGELMFDFGGEEEDAGADAGRRPLSLDGGQ